MSILEMSLSATFMIAAIWGIRSLALERLPKKTFLALWLAALIRLLIPFSIPSAFSVFTLLGKAGFSYSSGQLNTAAEVAVAAPSVVQAGPPAEVAAGGPEVSVSPALLIWIAGMAALGIWFTASYFRYYKKFKTSLPASHPHVEAWLGSHKTIRRIQVRVSDRIAAPLTYGVFRPVILLPRGMDYGCEQKLDYVLTHELVHIRRFDVLTKILLAAALCIHWFNPLVWVMYILANRDLELACDETVVRASGRASASSYAMTLINMQERSRMSPLHSGFSRYAIEERIRAIMKTKRTTLMGILIAFLIIAGTATAFATSATTTEAPPQAAGDSLQTIESYGEYEPYGLEFRAADELYYNGQLVRYFEDHYPVGESGTAGRDHYNKNGVIDVYAVRDFSGITPGEDRSFDPSGLLTGLRLASQQEFNALDTAWLENPETAAYAAESAAVSPDEMANLYAVYEPFGMTYDKTTDKLTYNGQSVRYFCDIMKVTGGDPESGSFSGTMRMGTFDEKGTVDVYTVRDASRSDADGYGMLTGLAPYSQDDFDERTAEMKQQGGALNAAEVSASGTVRNQAAASFAAPSLAAASES